MKDQISSSDRNVIETPEIEQSGQSTEEASQKQSDSFPFFDVKDIDFNKNTNKACAYCH